MYMRNTIVNGTRDIFESNCEPLSFEQSEKKATEFDQGWFYYISE